MATSNIVVGGEMDNRLILNEVRKQYSSGFQLGPITLEISSGNTVGFLGRNGAGKTTLIRTILGALRFDNGSATLGPDLPIPSKGSKDMIGYVDEEPIFYQWMNTRWIGRFLAQFYSRWDTPMFDNLVERLEIPRTRPYAQLSRGNKVKVGIAAALSTRPHLLLLDEPTSGLDPLVRHEILHLLRAYRQTNPTVITIFSSHIVSDLEKICDRVIMIDDGQIVWDQPIEVSPPRFQSDRECGTGTSSLEDKFLKLTLKAKPDGEFHDRNNSQGSPRKL